MTFMASCSPWASCTALQPPGPPCVMFTSTARAAWRQASVLRCSPAAGHVQISLDATLHGASPSGCRLLCCHAVLQLRKFQTHRFAMPCACHAVTSNHMATAPVAVAELLQPIFCCTANRAPATQHSHWGNDCSGDPDAAALQAGGS